MSRVEQREGATRQPVSEGPDTRQAAHPASRISSNAHIVIASLGIFLAALDQTVIVTALWPISTDLQIPVTQLDKAAWVITAYLLGYTVALPLMGRVADVYGQRRIYLLALGVFMAGSLLCALAPSLGWLIAARCLQAVGGGAVLPVGMAMCSHLFGQKRIPFMLGILGAVAEAGAVIGPLWGALIMQNLDGALNIVGWRWIFWVNLPLGLLFAALMLFTPVLPRFPGKIDWAGAALLGAGLLSLALALSTPGSVGVWAGLNSVDQSGNSELVTPQSIALLAAAILFFTGFAFRQRHAADPLFPPALFSRGSWPFVAANFTNLLVGAALIITMVNVPLYVASVLDGTAEQGGLMLLRMTAFIPVGAIAGGLLGVRASYRWIAVVGLLITSLGFWEMAGWTLTSADSLTTWAGLAANGLGFGLLISPVTATALQWGGLRRAALSAASVNLSRMIGTLVSISAVTVLGLRRFQELMSSHPAVLFANQGESAEAFAKRQADYITTYKAASLDVYTSGFLIAAIITLIAVALAIWLRRNPDSDVEVGPIF